MRRLLLATLIVAVPALASAADNVGECGWGSKLMEGQKGIGPQVLAVTTNGTFGNQTFGISTGTSGCTQDGVVRSNWKTAMFIDGNKTKIARDMSVGQGEALDSLASLAGVNEADKAAFFASTKAHYGEIFSRSDVSTAEIRASLKTVLSADASLAKYSDSI